MDHVISDRQNVSCEGAREILRGLKADRSLVPMACHGDRRLAGWRLHSIGLDWNYVETRFKRGNVEMHYTRWGTGTQGCTHVPPFVSDEPGA